MLSFLMAVFFLLPLAILEVLKWQTRFWWSLGYPWAVMGFVFWLANKICHVPLMISVCLVEQGMDKYNINLNTKSGVNREPIEQQYENGTIGK